MAKSASYFGLRRGSTRTHTYSVHHGTQVTKDRQEASANPQTIKQMECRLGFSLVRAARNKLENIVNHSFEYCTSANSNLREFLIINLKKGNLKPYQYVPKGVIDCGVSDLLISRGHLEPIVIFSGPEDSSLEDNTTYWYTDTDLPLYNGFAYKGANTISEFVYNVLTLNGVPDGTQLTFVFEYSLINSPYYWKINESIYQSYYHDFVCCRLVFSSKSSNKGWIVYNEELLYKPTIIDGNYYSPISLQFDGGLGITASWNFTGSFFTDKHPVAAAVIVSNTFNNRLQLSTARLVPNSLYGEIRISDVLPTYLKT